VAEPGNSLTPAEVETLAVYNGQVSQGLVHTDDWRRRMEELQFRFYQYGFFALRPRRWWRRG
jgi:hypothetical protein